MTAPRAGASRSARPHATSADGGALVLTSPDCDAVLAWLPVEDAPFGPEPQTLWRRYTGAFTPSGAGIWARAWSRGRPPSDPVLIPTVSFAARPAVTSE